LTLRVIFNGKKTQKYKIRIPGVRTDKVVELITLVAKPSGNISVRNQPINK